MARVIWTEPAVSELDAIADYIALDKPEAARSLVQKVFQKVELLGRFSLLGTKPSELKGMAYRQLFVSPCRIFYRRDKKKIFIVHVVRGEMKIKKPALRKNSFWS